MNPYFPIIRLMSSCFLLKKGRLPSHLSSWIRSETSARKILVTKLGSGPDSPLTTSSLHAQAKNYLDMFFSSLHLQIILVFFQESNCRIPIPAVEVRFEKYYFPHPLCILARDTETDPCIIDCCTHNSRGFEILVSIHEDNWLKVKEARRKLKIIGAANRQRIEFCEEYFLTEKSS